MEIIMFIVISFAAFHASEKAQLDKEGIVVESSYSESNSDEVLNEKQ